MNSTLTLPYLTIRGTVAYPSTEITLAVGRQKSIMAIDHALGSSDKYLVLVSQCRAEMNELTGISDIYLVGTLSKVEKSVKLDGAMKIHCNCLSRVSVVNLRSEKETPLAEVSVISDAREKGKIPTPERNEIVELLTKWRLKLQSTGDHSDLKHLTRETDATKFVVGILDVIRNFNIQKNNLNQNIVETAKKGLGRAYQEALDGNKDVINLLVAKRQAILEESSYLKRVLMLKNLLREELTMFEPSAQLQTSAP